MKNQEVHCLSAIHRVDYALDDLHDYDALNVPNPHLGFDAENLEIYAVSHMMSATYLTHPEHSNQSFSQDFSHHTI